MKRTSHSTPAIAPDAVGVAVDARATRGVVEPSEPALAAALRAQRDALARTERGIRALIDVIADEGASEHLTSALRDRQARARREKAALAELEGRARTADSLAPAHEAEAGATHGRASPSGRRGPFS